MFDTVKPLDPDQIYKCNWSAEMEIKTINGIVVRKFIDSNNHNIPTLTVATQDQKKEFEFVNEQSRFFEFTQVGDTVFKAPKTMKIEIRRNGSKFEKILDYGCQN